MFHAAKPCIETLHEVPVLLLVDDRHVDRVGPHVNSFLSQRQLHALPLLALLPVMHCQPFVPDRS